MNLQSVKSANRSSILYLLNEYKVLSRKELSQKLGITPAGVTKICQSLIDEGLIVEADSLDTGKSGRREVLLKLSLDDKLVFGINAQRDKITYSVSNLGGKLIRKLDTPFNENVDKVIAQGKAFLGDEQDVIGMGVCVIGSVDDDDYGIWHSEDLALKFSNAFGIDAVVENNVKAFAQSELIYGDLHNTDSVLFFKWGAGIGSSIVANGEVFSGNDSGVAEIGHYIVNAGGKKCRCGRFGCLETEASIDAIIDEIDDKLTLLDIVNSNNNDIITLLEHKINMVALVLTNTATILNTNNVVLFGEMFKNQIIVEKLKKQMLRYNQNLPLDAINLSTLNGISDYIGTTAICAKHFYFEREVN